MHIMKEHKHINLIYIRGTTEVLILQFHILLFIEYSKSIIL